MHSCRMLVTVIAICSYLRLGLSSSEMNEKVAMEQPWIWNRLKYTAEAYTAAAAAVDMVPTTELAKLDSLLHKTWPLQQLVDEQEETDDLTNLQLRLSSSNSRSSSSRSSSKREKDNDDLFGSASERALAWQMILKPIPQKKKQFRALTHFVDFRYPNSNDAQQQQQQQQQQQHRQQQQPRILPLMGSHAALSKLHDESAILLRKILRQAAWRQSKKRSPNCMRKCIAQGLLHPAQCHSLC